MINNITKQLKTNFRIVVCAESSKSVNTFQKARRAYTAPQVTMEIVQLEISIAAGSAQIDTTNNDATVLQSWEVEIDHNQSYSW